MPPPPPAIMPPPPPPVVYRQVQHLVPCHHSREYRAATAHGDDDTPQLAVKQYIPLDNPDPQPGDLTIIAAHANGFPKELYEPLWLELHGRTASRGVRIRSIWIADMWNQGQSGRLNEKMLGHDPSWLDHARDLMNLINLKQHLMPHPLIGIGHSMGATQLCLLSLAHPRLLHSLILIDPVIQPYKDGVGIEPVIRSTHRRDIWPSRDAAATSFKQNNFYQAWDPRVLDLWIKHGLRQTPTEIYPSQGSAPDQRVTLTTSKHQEVFNYLRPTFRGQPAETFADMDPELRKGGLQYPFYRPEPTAVFRRLPELRPSILYVFGAKSEISAMALRHEKMALTGTGVGGSGGVAAGRVQQVVLDCGHLVAMEKVGDCADAVSAFVCQEIGRWRRERREHDQYWQQKSRLEQATTDETWRREVDAHAPPARKSTRL